MEEWQQKLIDELKNVSKALKENTSMLRGVEEVLSKSDSPMINNREALKLLNVGKNKNKLTSYYYMGELPSSMKVAGKEWRHNRMEIMDLAKKIYDSEITANPTQGKKNYQKPK